MHCQRCGGFMVAYSLYWKQTLPLIWHCLNCGSYIDKVIVRNRNGYVQKKEPDEIWQEIRKETQRLCGDHTPSA